MSAETNSQIHRVLADEGAEQLLNALFMLIKTARMVDTRNDMFKKQSQHFYDLMVSEGIAQRNLCLRIVAGRFFIGEKMVRFHNQDAEGIVTILQEWEQLGIGGICFHSNITKEELDEFFAFTACIRPKSDNLELLANQLKNLHQSRVEFLSVKQAADNEPDVDVIKKAPPSERKKFRAKAQKSFHQALQTVEQLVIKTGEGEGIDFAHTRRVVHALIDQIQTDESSMLELASIKDFDDYTYAHSTNVCIYSLLVGMRLNMDRSSLTRLGFASLFHDIGKVRLPEDLINKPTMYNERDWMQMKRHTLMGAKTILRNLKYDKFTACAARVAFEHHLGLDFSGYPELKISKTTPKLFSRIVAIADTFDELTSGRLNVSEKIQPDIAIKRMMSQTGQRLDDVLFKLFHGIIGIYPVGSAILLTTK